MDKFNDTPQQATLLTIFSVKRIQGKAVLTLSSGEVYSMPRSMLKERPYRGGMPFDKASFLSFLTERSYPFAMEKAVSLLACRARTEKEIEEALQKNAYPEKTIAHVMQRLHESGYINDREFAEHWIASRTSKGLGTRKIRMELRQKGVAAEDVDEILSQVEDDDLMAGAVKAAQKAMRGKDLSNPTDKQKIMMALARRGFDYSTARAAIEQIMSQD